MADKQLFFYFGDDEAYFKALQSEFQKNLKLTIDFKRFFESEEVKIQSFYPLIFSKRPAVVFIDFSKNTLEYLHLARLISRIKLETKIVTIGLVDYLSPPQVLAESMATGVDFTHIKGPETYDVSFGIAKLLTPQEGGEHGFANADLKETWQGGAISKVGFIHHHGLHIETNFPIKNGDRLKLNHQWQRKKTVPSGEVFVKETGNQNLFYHYDQWADLDFIFIDEFLPPEGMEPDKIKEKQNERDANIIFHKKQLKKWINDNTNDSLEKKGKVFVIDRDLHFYSDQRRSDRYSYVIRCAPYLMDLSFEMNRLRPLVIAFALEKPEATEPKNTMEVLQRIAKFIKAQMTDLNPFLVVFNSPESSGQLQQSLNYQNILACKEELTVELLDRMAQIYEKKRVIGQLNKIKDAKIFLNKTSSSSLCEIILSINLLKLSESDLHFQSDQPLPIGLNLHFTEPVDMYVNIQLPKNQTNPPTYQGIIHGIGESSKKDLRKFVNTIFFRDHDAALQAELDEFKNLNDAKLQEKEAVIAAKKAEEEAKKAEAEKAKDSPKTDTTPQDEVQPPSDQSTPSARNEKTTV
jgi:hypothetical protein